MERISISIDEALASEFDALIAERGYSNRSEAIRDLVRRELEAARQAGGTAPHCVANLSYIYNHHQRELSERLTEVQHEHHDLTVATVHAHLDHDHCIESTILRGPTVDVRRFADRVCAERGVRHGQLNLVTVELHGDHRGHEHGHEHTAQHIHIKPAR